MEVTPGVRDFLVQLDDLLDAREWPRLDRDRVTTAPGRDAVLTVLPHQDDPRLNLDIQVDDRLVVVNYGPEHQHFTAHDEALRFIEMLGDGRVRLVVKRSLFWNSIKSYRDDLTLPFARTSEPWLNLRPRTDRYEFGFQSVESQESGGNA